MTRRSLPRPATTAEGRAEQLARWERLWMPWLVVSAILPLIGVVAPNQDNTHSVISIATWLVFVIDLAVHMALIPRYLRSKVGVFDLTIVLVTAPWYLLLGSTGSFAVAARLARLARIVWLGVRQVHGLRRLAQRLGRVVIYAAALMVGCALIEKWTEPPSAGFTTYGDSLWWAMVTITTVGYGDLVPQGSVGRVTAAVLMLGGVAFLGSLAAALAAFFGFGGTEEPDDDATPPPAADVTEELAALRGEIAALRADLAATDR